MSTLNTGIYQLDRLPFSSREFHNKFTSIAGPLSLFDVEDNPEVGNVNPEVERPLTPVEEAIKAPPPSFSAFAKLIRPRLLPRNIIPGISISDQNELIGVIMNEINNIWGEMKTIPPDPFLSREQNTELQRRLAIEIVIIAQGLFVKYLDKAQRLNDRGVFSAAANMSRLKTQLALDANKSFNILSIRRDLAMDMKHPSDGSISSSRFSIQRFLASTPPPQTYKPLVIRQEDRRNRVHLTKEEKLQRRVESEISDLQRKMPTVTAAPYYGMVPAEALLRHKTTADAESVKSGAESELLGVQERDLFFREKKCDSEPYMPVGESLLDELGIDVELHNKDVSRRVKSARKVKDVTDDADEKKFAKQPEPGSSEYAANDLKRLLASRSGRPLQGELQGDQQNDDLPPLLQALALHSISKPKKHHVTEDATQAHLDEPCGSSVIGSTEASSIALDHTIIDESITEFSGEEHPQPSVVSQRLPDKSVVRTSDVRVSNRVNKSSVTMKRYPTVYNDLTGEIEPHTVKWLDRNLFIGEEIKEVYEEIIRTMRTDHLHFDADNFVENAASHVDTSVCTASSSLAKGKGERIMNTSLHMDMPPPWGEDTADNWRNSPKFGGLGREDILQAKIGKGAEGGTGSKSYNSWLAWWRSTITYDDYLKYLSTQENDYLATIFHLYDSEQESEDEGDALENRPDTIQMALTREREKKMSDLKTKKTDFKPGFWNANSIMLGGLGQDPIIEDDELLANIETPFLSAADSLPQGRLSNVSRGSQKSDVSSSDKRSVRSKDSSTSDKQMPQDRKKTGVSFDKRSESPASATGKSESSGVPSLSAQDRLERLWTLLCMPDALRLDMAIKYSAEPHSHNLEEAIDAWEAATEVVLERESLMTRLEDFERTASDPNRFFEKGGGGTASSRIRESKTRECFDKRLSELDREVKRTVTTVRKRFGDTVTFQGRPYMDKIQMDRTEMLYWLQQERRQNAFDADFVRTREITLRVPELPSLATDLLL